MITDLKKKITDSCPCFGRKETIKEKCSVVEVKFNSGAIKKQLI